MPTTEETQLRLAEIPNLTVSAHTPLSRYTRFGIGGPADLFAETRDEQAPNASPGAGGKEVWTFHLVPQPGEPGNDTWGPDGWLYAGHGRTSPSDVGRPGTPADQRIHCDGGVYRWRNDLRVS
jgi:hypothetical protein